MVNTSFLTCLYLFEDVFRKKLSKNEIFFVNLHQKDASLLTLDRIDASIILFSLNRSLRQKLSSYVLSATI